MTRFVNRRVGIPGVGCGLSPLQAYSAASVPSGITVSVLREPMALAEAEREIDG